MKERCHLKYEMTHWNCAKQFDHCELLTATNDGAGWPAAGISQGVSQCVRLPRAEDADVRSARRGSKLSSDEVIWSRAQLQSSFVTRSMFPQPLPNYQAAAPIVGAHARAHG